MKQLILPTILSAVILSACSSASTNIFSKKTPLEKYEAKLEDNGLEKTPEGRQWLAASKTALQQPVAIELPYRHAGNFSSVKPQAIGLSFTATRGQRLTFDLAKNDTASFVLYAELYRQDATGSTTLLQSPDTNVSTFSYNVPETGNYVLKIQPQLFRVGNYELSVSTGPSLHFPVGDKKAYIGSVWGDNRDGGKRSHEGVDIFAPKRTPAVAAADGYITGVREGGIGGKTVWLRPEGQNYTLYYAHLDEQLVQEGQRVKTGDTLGLVGNTGNARTTPPHLHFGIYGFGGALDPYPFVNRQVKTAPAVSAKKMTEQLRLVKELKLSDFTAKKNTLLMPLAVTSKGYIAELPDGRLVQTSFAAVQSAGQPIKKTKAALATALYKLPSADADSTITLQPGSSVSVLGYFGEYAYIRSGETEGWILESNLKG
ncbi:MAG TPA: M23 family metallopeptidase [Flavisolibacter sp.]|nr:M23 family metallopeptidase [Flavisolibacter sp.]